MRTLNHVLVYLASIWLLVSAVAHAATFDVPRAALIGTYCVPIIRNDAGQFCDPVQVDAFGTGCRMARECRYVLETQWPVTQNRRFHPQAIMTLFVRPTRPMLPTSDYCFPDRGAGAYVAYINQWGFFHANSPLPRCAFPDYGSLSFAEANAIWSNPNNLRMPREIVLPVPWNIQSIRPPNDEERQRFFPAVGAPTGEAARWFFLQSVDGNRGPAYESTVGASIPRQFSEFTVPRTASEIWHPDNDIRVYFNKRPICSTNYNEWHQTNHRSSPNIAVTQNFGFGFNRLTDEVRSVATHNTAAYPFDDDADVTASFTSLQLDCIIGITKAPNDAAGATRFVRIAQCIGVAPTCSDANNCEFIVKLDAAFASNRGAACLFPTPRQMVGPTCLALFDALRDTTPSRTCACGAGQFINQPDSLGQYFSYAGFGLSSLAVSRVEPDPAAEFLLAYPLWTWAGEKYLSFEFARERYCDLHGALHDVPGWPAALITSGILALANSYSSGFRRDVGKQHVGTATVELRRVLSPELVLLAPGLRNDDRLSIADVLYSSTPVVNGQLLRDGSNRRLTLRGFDQGVAAPRPLNTRALDFERLSRWMPRCRLTYAYDIARTPPNSTSYENWLRATGAVVQPRRVVGAFDTNTVVTSIYVDSVPSNDFFIHSYATVYRNDPFVPNNNYGNVELRNSDLYQAYVPFQSAAIGVRKFNDFDPVDVAFEVASVSNLLPPCDCRGDSGAASIPGGVVCSTTTSGDQIMLNEVTLTNPEVGTYQQSPINCSITVDDALPGTLSSDVLVMQSRFYVAQGLFEPSTLQNHGIIWYSWQLSGVDVKTAIVGNSTSRTAFYNLRSVPIKFRTPGFYTLTLGISTGRTRLYLQCAQRIQVLAGCPSSFIGQTSSITKRNHPVTLSAMMPDNGIGGALFEFQWNVYSTLPAGISNAATISKMGNAVVSFTSSQIGEFLVSLDVSGRSQPASQPFCRSFALFKISVVNDTTTFNRFVSPDALVIPSVCLGSVGNFTTDELPGTTQSIEESSLLSASFSLNKNVFNVFFSDQFQSRALEVAAVVASALGLPTSQQDPMRGKQVRTGSRMGAQDLSTAPTANDAALAVINTTLVVGGSILFAALLLVAAFNTRFFVRFYNAVYDALWRKTMFDALRSFDRAYSTDLAYMATGKIAEYTIRRAYKIRDSSFAPPLWRVCCFWPPAPKMRKGYMDLTYRNRTVYINYVELLPFGKALADENDGNEKRLFELSNAAQLFKLYILNLKDRANSTVPQYIVVDVPRHCSDLVTHLRKHTNEFGHIVWSTASSDSADTIRFQYKLL